jgi:hypothetical protein
MATLFLVFLAVFGAILLLQLALDVAGGTEIFDFDAAAPADALHLRSARAISAGGTFFGIGGLASLGVGLPALLALPVALVAGGSAATGVAALMRAMHRLENDGSLRMQDALGQPGTVYLSIPAARGGPGKVHLALQNRTVEVQAVTDHGVLPTGTPIVVVDVISDELVEVVPASTLGGLLNG